MAGSKDGGAQTFFLVAGKWDGVQTFLQGGGKGVGAAQTPFLMIEAW